MSSQADLLFGKLAVMNRFATQEQIDECIALQERYTADGMQMSLGEILQKKGYLKPNQVPAILRAQQYMALRSEDIRFGQIAVANKFATQAQIDEALGQQQEDFKKGRKVQRVGKMMLDQGRMNPQQVNAVLKAQDRIKSQSGPSPAAPPTQPAPTRTGAVPSNADTQPISISSLEAETPKTPAPAPVRRTGTPPVARPAAASPQDAPTVKTPLPGTPPARTATPARRATPPPAPADDIPEVPVAPPAAPRRPTAFPAAETPVAPVTPKRPTEFRPAPTAKDIPSAPVAPGGKRPTEYRPAPTAKDIPSVPVAPTTKRPTEHRPAPTARDIPAAPVAPTTKRPTEFRAAPSARDVPSAPPAGTQKTSRPTGIGPSPAGRAPVVPATPAKTARPTGSVPTPAKGPATPVRPTSATPRPAAPAPPPAAAAADTGEQLVVKLSGAQIIVRQSGVTHKSGQLWNIHIVGLQGNLDGKTFPHVEEFLNNLMDQGNYRFVLNCKGMDYLSSAGVGVLISVARRAREVQGDIVLAEVPKKVQSILNLLGLGSYLTSYPVEKEALAAFAQS